MKCDEYIYHSPSQQEIQQKLDWKEIDKIKDRLCILSANFETRGQKDISDKLDKMIDIVKSFN